jgi:hypothetical protein
MPSPPVRRVLVDLVLARLANPTASAAVPLLIAPDGTLTRESTPMPDIHFGPGTFSFQVPANVTALAVAAQGAGGGGSGGSVSSTQLGAAGTDGGTTELRRGSTVLVRANGGKGAQYGPPVGSNACRGGSGGLGGVSFRGGNGSQSSPSGGAAGVNTVDTQRGQPGNASAEASAGAGGAPGSNSPYASGGGGEYVLGGVVVTPGETLTVSVGAPGVGGNGFNTTVTSGRNGGPGFLILSW